MILLIDNYDSFSYNLYQLIGELEPIIRVIRNDEMTVQVELGKATDDFQMLDNLCKEITRRLKDEILLTPKVQLVGKGTIPQSEGKAVRVKDLRNNH